MKLYPLSLKKKHLDQMISEVKEKNITSVLDVRRSPITRRNSAKWFLREPFEEALWAEGIHYLHMPIISNKKRVTNYKEFFTTDILAVLNTLELPNSNYGFVCYCDENTQQQLLCHAVWIADWLHRTKYPEAQVIL